MIRLLIVDDEERIRAVVSEYAKMYGYSCDQAADGLEALALLRTHTYDLVILDIMMPNLDGFTACREIKKIQEIPVIMLSARQEEYDKLYGFELGIDDYITKPFSPKELMARVKAVYERYAKRKTEQYRFQGLVIDVLGRSVSVDDVIVNLTPKEFDLLLYLVEHRNQALSRESLLEHVWNYSFYGDDRTVDTHIKMLRHNLGPYRDMIVTIRGMGYKFEA